MSSFWYSSYHYTSPRQWDVQTYSYPNTNTSYHYTSNRQWNVQTVLSYKHISLHISLTVWCPDSAIPTQTHHIIIHLLDSGVSRLCYHNTNTSYHYTSPYIIGVSIFWCPKTNTTLSFEVYKNNVHNIS